MNIELDDNNVPNATARSQTDAKSTVGHHVGRVRWVSVGRFWGGRGPARQHTEIHALMDGVLISDSTAMSVHSTNSYTPRTVAA